MIRSATGRAPVTSQAALQLHARIQTLHKHYTIGIRMYLSMKSSLVFLIFFFSSNTRMALSAPQSDEFELQFYSTMLMDRGREPYSHAVMEEHHRWKAFRFLVAGYPK